MKIAAFSDPHGEDIIDLVPECDVLCICGDISPNDAPHTIDGQRAWYRDVGVKDLLGYRSKAKHVVFIAGNHDRFLYSCHLNGQNDAEVRAMLPDGIHYLDGESVVIDGVKFHGNPWSNCPFWAEPGGAVWNFASKNQEFLAAMYKDIPGDVDVLLTHGPAFGFCDCILDQGVVNLAAEKYGDSLKAEHLGCRELAQRILTMSGDAPPLKRLKHVLSGHIHSASHEPERKRPFGGNHEIEFRCVSILDEQYELGRYKPLELELNS